MSFCAINVVGFHQPDSNHIDYDECPPDDVPQEDRIVLEDYAPLFFKVLVAAYFYLCRSHAVLKRDLRCKQIIDRGECQDLTTDAGVKQLKENHALDHLEICLMSLEVLRPSQLGEQSDNLHGHLRHRPLVGPERELVKDAFRLVSLPHDDQDFNQEEAHGESE